MVKLVEEFSIDTVTLTNILVKEGLVPEEFADGEISNIESKFYFSNDPNRFTFTVEKLVSLKELTKTDDKCDSCTHTYEEKKTVVGIDDVERPIYKPVITHKGEYRLNKEDAEQLLKNIKTSDKTINDNLKSLIKTSEEENSNTFNITINVNNELRAKEFAEKFMENLKKVKGGR